MVEMFKTIFTDKGLEKLAEATATGVALDLYQIAVGDSNGSYYEPTKEQTTLINEVGRFELNSLMVEADNKKRFSAEILIPEDSGGYTIREAGLFDRAGDLIAVSKVPATLKPSIDSGAGSQLYFKMIGEYSTDVNITISINPRGLFVTDDVMKNYIASDVYPKIAEGDVETLLSAKGYADEKDIETLTTANAYADNGDSNTLETTKNYVDLGLAEKSPTNHAHSLTGVAITDVLPVVKGGTGRTDGQIMMGENGSVSFNRKEGSVVGPYSTSIGLNSVADSSSAIAIGNGSSATAQNNISIGTSAESLYGSSIAIGSSAKAKNGSAIAIGKNAVNEASDSIVIGTNASAKSFVAIVIGLDAKATIGHNIVIGRNASASGMYNTVIGDYAYSSGSTNTALGYGAQTGAINHCMQLGGSELSSIRSKVTSITSSSDIRDKTDFENIDEDKALELILKTGVYHYVDNSRSKYKTLDEKAISVVKTQIAELEAISEKSEDVKQKLNELERELELLYNPPLYDDKGNIIYDKEAHATASKKGERVRVGVKAQDVYRDIVDIFGNNKVNLVNDEKVDNPDIEENQLGVNYTNFVPLLIATIQKQHKTISRLEDKVTELEKKIVNK